MQEKQFLTKVKFGKLVDDAVRAKKMTYMDAIIDVCDRNEVELEEVRRFISPVLKEKIEAEAMKLNFLPRQNTLPID